jgi:hypothetical protein
MALGPDRVLIVGIDNVRLSEASLRLVEVDDYQYRLRELLRLIEVRPAKGVLVANARRIALDRKVARPYVTHRTFDPDTSFNAAHLILVEPGEQHLLTCTFKTLTASPFQSREGFCLSANT